MASAYHMSTQGWAFRMASLKNEVGSWFWYFGYPRKSRGKVKH